MDLMRHDDTDGFAKIHETPLIMWEEEKIQLTSYINRK